ncbi:MAG: hypothetical protein P8018_06135 [Acidobacteriota bacterium]
MKKTSKLVALTAGAALLAMTCACVVGPPGVAAGATVAVPGGMIYVQTAPPPHRSS